MLSSTLKVFYVDSATLLAKRIRVYTLLLGIDLFTNVGVIRRFYLPNPHQSYAKQREGKERVGGSVNHAFFNLWA